MGFTLTFVFVIYTFVLFNSTMGPGTKFWIVFSIIGLPFFYIGIEDIKWELWRKKFRPDVYMTPAYDFTIYPLIAYVLLSIFFGGGDYKYVQILNGVLLVAIVIYIALRKDEHSLRAEPQRRKRKKRKNRKKRAKKEREKICWILIK